MPTLKIAYILLHFPYLTETFVAEEIQAVQRNGVQVQIISLLDPGPGPVHPLSQKLLPHTWYAPGLSSLKLWKAQFYFLLRTPFLYVQLLLTLLRQPYPHRSFTMLAKRGITFLKATAIAYHLKNSGIQFVHAHFAWLPGAAAWIIARLLRVNFTVTIHAYDIYASNDLLPLISREAAQLMAISDYNRQYVTTQLKLTPSTISIVRCGVNLTQLEQKSLVNLSPSGRTLKILSVGSLVAKKGHKHLIDACHLLKQHGLEFECSIIGAGPDQAKLQRQINEHGLDTQVKLLGGRAHPEIISAYQDHDIFVLASVTAPGGDQDGIPVVLMEAAAMRLPLVSTEISGIPELVRHNQTGWLVPPNNAEALAEAILSIAADPSLRKRLGENARKIVEAEFDVAVNARHLVKLFEKNISVSG